MRILIIGAGIAGLTLAALLKQRGIHPVVIEKASSLGSVGYMLGLYPTGANVLRAIHKYDHYLAHSVAGNQYEAYSDKGVLLSKLSFAPIVKQYGAYQLISRYELLNIIHQACGELDLRFNTELLAIEQESEMVSVTFTNGQQEKFDLVVGADGLHSCVRSLIWSKDEHQDYHTGWGGWVWWCENNVSPENTIQEFWGKGNFFGAYPVQGKIGVIAVVDSPTAEDALKGMSRKAYLEKKFAHLWKRKPEFFSELPNDDQPVFFWSLNDQMVSTWHKHRVVLLGDSAIAFLPTAGIGASMALESAAALDDILSRTDPHFIPAALAQFEKRRKKRVEKAQKASRGLAKLMFTNSPWRAWLRNYITKHMSAESLIRTIIQGFDDPI